MTETPVNGIIVVDKPVGLTSNAVLSHLKRLLGVSKGGFLGTLDPLASGVLPVFFGKATKLISAFEGLEKEYRVTLKLGVSTDTLDAQGQVVAEHSLEGLGAGQVRQAIVAREGESRQTAPHYSALKFDGVPAYRLARQGKPVPPRTRTVHLSGIVVEAVRLPHATFRVSCSAGTYMRSLAADIGESLGVGAHVTGLARLRCGDLFTAANSITLEAIEAACGREDHSFLLNPSVMLTDYLPVTFGITRAQQLRHGRTIPLDLDKAHLPIAAKIQALEPSGALIAIGEVVRMREHALGFQPSKVLI